MKKLIVTFLVFSMFLIPANVSHADYNSLFNELIAIGIPDDGTAGYLTMALLNAGDSTMRDQWALAGLVTILSEDPPDVTLTDYGRAAIYNMKVTLTQQLISIGIPGGGMAESIAEYLFMDDAFRSIWETEGYIISQYDAQSRVTGIAITPAGELMIPVIFSGVGVEEMVLAIHLHQAITANNLQADFETMYGIPLAQQILTDMAYKSALTGIASYMLAHDDFTQDGFLYELEKTAELHRALDTIAGLRDIFANVSGIAIADQDPALNPDYRAYLAGVVNAPGYDLATYIAMLEDPNVLHIALDPGTLRADFELMYGIPVAEQILTNPAYLSLIQGISSYIKSVPGYEIHDFINELEKSAELHRALGDRNLRDIFAAISGIAVIDQDPVANPAYTGYLAGIVNGISYGFDTYILTLEVLNAIHLGLNQGTLRADFALMYGVPVADQNLGNPIYLSLIQGVATYIIATPDFGVSNFLYQLEETAKLHRALEDRGLRGLFEAISGISVADQLAITTEYIGYLAGVANGVGYDFDTYIMKLQLTNDIHLALGDIVPPSSLRHDFWTIYGIVPDWQLLPNLSYREIIEGIASYIFETTGYEVINFIQELATMADIHEALQADPALQADLEFIYGIPVADQNPVTNDTYRYFLAGTANHIIFTDGYEVSDFLASLPIMIDVHQALQADPLLQADFAIIYGIAPADQSPATNEDYRYALAGIASYVMATDGYEISDFLAGLPIMVDVHQALERNPLLQIDFAIIYGIAFESPITTDAYRNTLAGIASYILATDGYEVSDFLAGLPIMVDVHQALEQSPLLQADFEIIYGIAPADQDPVTNENYRDALAGIASHVLASDGYEISDFLAGLPIMVDVHQALIADPSLQLDFEVIYDIAPADQDPIANEKYRYALAGIASYIAATAGYEVSDFLAGLPIMVDVHQALIRDPSLQLDFEIIYGIAPADQDPVTNEDYCYALAGIAMYIIGIENYEVSDFLAGLPIMADVHLALIANNLQANFEVIYGIPIDQQDPVLNTDYVYALAGIASYIIANAGYEVGDFVVSLPVMVDVHNTLIADPLRQANFEVIYGIAPADQDPVTNENYRDVLSGIVSYIIATTGYEAANFFAELAIMAGIHEGLQQNPLLQIDFELMYGIAVADQDPITNEKYRHALAGIASYIAATAGYDFSNFVTELSAIADLHRALDNNDLRDEFAIFSGISVADQLAITTEYIGYLAGIINGTGYSLGRIINQLIDLQGTTSLHDALIQNNLQAEFELMYGTPVAEQVLTNRSYTDILTGIASYIAGQPGFTQEDFLRELRETAKLHRALDLYDLREAFEIASGIAVEDQDPLTNDFYSGCLVSIVNHPDYNFEYVIAWLGADVTFEYYASGNLKSITSSEPDLDGNIKYEYYDEDFYGNQVGRLEKITRADGSYDVFVEYWTGTDRVKIKEVYDSAGSLVARYEYYLSGNLKSKTLPQPDIDGNIKYEYHDEDFYGDGAGRLEKITRADGSYELFVEYWGDTGQVRIKREVKEGYFQNTHRTLDMSEWEYYQNGTLREKKEIYNRYYFETNDLVFSRETTWTYDESGKLTSKLYLSESYTIKGVRKRTRSTLERYNANGVKIYSSESVTNYDKKTGAVVDSYCINSSFDDSGKLISKTATIFTVSKGEEKDYTVTYDIGKNGNIIHTHVFDGQGNEIENLGGDGFIHASDITTALYWLPGAINYLETVLNPEIFEFAGWGIEDRVLSYGFELEDGLIIGIEVDLNRPIPSPQMGGIWGRSGLLVDAAISVRTKTAEMLGIAYEDVHINGMDIRPCNGWSFTIISVSASGFELKCYYIVGIGYDEPKLVMGEITETNTTNDPDGVAGMIATNTTASSQFDESIIGELADKPENPLTP